MKPDSYLRTEAPMDWQDRCVLLACILTSIALAIILATE